MIPEAGDPRLALTYALAKYPERVEAVPLRRLVTESARQNPRRPAYVQLSVPDELVKNLRGDEEAGDLVLLVRVPRDVLERQGSRIVLPGEVS